MKNKIIQLQWMLHRGATFHVLPRQFVVEQRHSTGENYEQVIKHFPAYDRLCKAFVQARAEMEAGAFPMLSNTTRGLLQEQERRLRS
jgi:hypothetical protein